MVALRTRQQPQRDLQGDAKEPLRAHEKSGEIRPHSLKARRAELHELPIGKDGANPQHMVGCHAVLQAMHAAGVEGDIAADGADELARWIRSVIEAVALRGLGYLQIDRPGLDHGDSLAGIQPENPVETIESNDDPVLNRQRTSREAGSAAAGHEGNAVVMTGSHRGDHLLGALGKDHCPRTGFEGGQGIRLIGRQLGSGGEQAAGRIGFLQLFE